MYGTTKSTKNNTNNERSSRIFRNILLVNKSISKKKQIPCSKVGGKFLFRIQVLDEYLSCKEKESIKY